MFELGPGLRKLFGGEGAAGVFQDGLTGGDAALYELLDLNLLVREAKAADIAAGRIGAKDRARRLLEAGCAWREAARRSGDAAMLRKGAAQAEAAAAAFDRRRRPDGWALARGLQASCALLGAELFGDDGLAAAAGCAFAEAAEAARAPVSAARARLGASLVRAHGLEAGRDTDGLRAVLGELVAPSLTPARPAADAQRLADLDLALARAAAAGRLALALADRPAVQAALARIRVVRDGLDEAYQPVLFARALIAEATLLTGLADLVGALEPAAEAVETATRAVGALTRDHSPLDWARAQVALAAALHAVGDAAEDPRALEQAATAYDRAEVVLRRAPGLTLRCAVAANRAAALARQAELTGDLAILDAAELALKTELCARPASRDPVAWALAQTQLARLYVARAEITGHDGGRRAAAGLALSTALDVFAEHGLPTHAAAAQAGLSRLRALV